MQNESVSYLESFVQQLIAVCRPAGSTAGAKELLVWILRCNCKFSQRTTRMSYCRHPDEACRENQNPNRPSQSGGSFCPHARRKMFPHIKPACMPAQTNKRSWLAERLTGVTL